MAQLLPAAAADQSRENQPMLGMDRVLESWIGVESNCFDGQNRVDIDSPDGRIASTTEPIVVLLA